MLLGQLFQNCLQIDALRDLAEAQLEVLFRCRRRRVFFEADFPDDFFLQDNPLVRQFTQEQSAMHEAQVVDNATWRACCPRADHGHVLVGPLVGQGRLLGVAAVTRLEEDPAFSDQEVRAMNRFCLFLSTRLCELRPPASLQALTPRENQVCQAVCRGLRNAQAARELSVTEHTVKQNLKSIYRKLGVSSRSELILVATAQQPANQGRTTQFLPTAPRGYNL